MNRKERRAAEHAARKAARKAGFPAPVTPTTPDPAIESNNNTRQPLHPCRGPNANICDNVDCATCTAYLNEDDEPTPTPTARPLSEARLEANRRAAQASTGPKSPEGKAKVSQNAVKTALTGRTVLLPFDNIDAYQTLLSEWMAEFTPVGPIEKGLVQSLVDTAWRLERIPGLEYALLENGYNQLGHENADVALATPQITVELHIRLVKEKAFRNLQIQENRLVRRRERELKELRELQATRKASEGQELKQAAELALVAEHHQQPFQVEKLGFVFSTERFAQFMARLTPSMKQNLLKEALATTSETKKAAA